MRGFLKDTLLAILVVGVLAYLAFGAVGLAYGADETIRPTGAFDQSARWANEANAYDNSLTTYADIGSVQDGLLYVGATTTIGTDAWDTPSATYESAELYCTYSSDGWDGNDTFAVEIRNGADTILATHEAATGSAIAKTTKLWTLTSGYLSDPTDLRCVGNFQRTGGPDTGNSYIYEVWIVGVVGGRQRSILMSEKEEVQDEKAIRSTIANVGDSPWLVSRSVRRYSTHIE